jgi:hypothetical protein
MITEVIGDHLCLNGIEPDERLIIDDNNAGRWEDGHSPA